MKRTLVLLSALMILFASSCKKDEGETPETPTTAGNSYKLNGTTYNVAYSGTSTVNGHLNYIFADRTPAAGEFNFLTVKFKGTPTTGTYQLVTMANNPPIANANQCQIGASNNTTLGYGYVGTGTVNIDVTVTGGKIKIVIPEISVETTPGGAMVKLSGTVNGNL